MTGLLLLLLDQGIPPPWRHAPDRRSSPGRLARHLLIR